MFYPFSLGVFFTGSATFLMVYCIKELGAVITGYSNYIQIIFGVLFGVLFLNEWENYSSKEVFLSICGLIILFISVIIGLILKQPKQQKLPCSVNAKYGLDYLLSFKWDNIKQSYSY